MIAGVVALLVACSTPSVAAADSLDSLATLAEKQLRAARELFLSRDSVRDAVLVLRAQAAYIRQHEPRE